MPESPPLLLRLLFVHRPDPEPEDWLYKEPVKADQSEHGKSDTNCRWFACKRTHGSRYCLHELGTWNCPILQPLIGIPWDITLGSCRYIDLALVAIVARIIDIPNRGCFVENGMVGNPKLYTYAPWKYQHDPMSGISLAILRHEITYTIDVYTAPHLPQTIAWNRETFRGKQWVDEFRCTVSRCSHVKEKLLESLGDDWSRHLLDKWGCTSTVYLLVMVLPNSPSMPKMIISNRETPCFKIHHWTTLKLWTATNSVK